MLLVLSAYVAVSLGRVHQLIPALEVLHLGVVTGLSSVAMLIASRRPSIVWPQIDGRIRFLVLGLLAWILLSVPLSLYPGMSFNMWRDAVVQACALAFVVAIAMRSEEDVRRLILVFVVAVAFYATVILRSFGLDLDVRLGELYSYDANDFAQVVVCTLPLCGYLILRTRSGAGRAFYGILVGLFLLVLIKSGSRGGFLGLVAVAGAAITSWKAVQWKWRVGALMTGVLFLVIVGSDTFWSRVASIGDTKNDYNVTSESGRIQAWKRGISYMRRHPVLGVGVGAFGMAEGTISDLAVAARRQGRENVKWMAPHNSFVQIGAETGLPGLAMFVALLVVVLRSTHRMAVSPTDQRRNRPQQLAGALFLSLVGFSVTAFFLSQAYSALLYFLIGMVAAITRIASPGKVAKPASSRISA